MLRYRPRIVSLFNGIGVGYLALRSLGIRPGEYFTSELCPWANKISKKHNPDVIPLGDASKITASMFEGKRVELVMGGSPCQSFSVAGDGKGFADPRGTLLAHFFRIVSELKPKYFLLENVVMSDHHQRVVSKIAGVEPVTLDSSWWCAQQRKRMFWTNIPLPSLPGKSRSVLADVMGIPVDDADRRMWPIKVRDVKRGGQGNRVYSPCGKSITLSAYSGGTAGTCNLLVGDHNSHRKLTIRELERLQMLPDGYTLGVPDNHRRRIIGNAWTMGVIAYILSGMEKT